LTVASTPACSARSTRAIFALDTQHGTYRDYIDLEQLRQRVTTLNGAGTMDKESAAVLNREGFVAARGCSFTGENVWLEIL
jgi:hypothetical protein